MSAPQLVAVRPWGNAGYKFHVAEDNPEGRERTGSTRRLFRCMTLCRLRADGASRRAGMKPNYHLLAEGIGVGWRKGMDRARRMDESYVCRTCAHRAAKRDEGDR